MAQESKAEIFSGVSIKDGTRPTKIANNTWRYTRPDGATAIRLHHTDILVQEPGGTWTYDTGGWHTVTTKDRFNAYGPLKVWSVRGGWQIGGIHYFDGVRVKDGVILNAPKAEKAAKADAAMAKRIDAYMAGLKSLPSLPLSSNGDCWLCLFRREDGKPALACDDGGHLESHLKEKYYHGSLLARAIEAAGARPEVYLSMMNVQPWARRKVEQWTRRYLRKAFKLAV